MADSADAVAARAIDHPADPAVTDAAGCWTNVELDRRVDAIVRGARRAGISKGSFIAALLEDGSPMVALVHAARRLGATLVPLNRRAAEPEHRQQLAVVGATVLVHDVANSSRATALSHAGPPAVTMTDLMASPSAPPEPVSPIDPGTPAVILFTSGTGGPPKAAVLTHANLKASVDAWAFRLEPRTTDRWLVCLPLFHIAGLAIVARADSWGLPLLVHSGFDAAAVDAAIDCGISHLSLVPQMLDRLLEHRGGRDVPESLRGVLVGGGPVDVSGLARARSVGMELIITYGMTETASGVASGTLASDGAEQLPRLYPLEGATLSIDRSTSGTGDIGEIVVHGAMVSPGYVEDGRLPARARRGHTVGTFHSGDFGSLEADGGLVIADRRDDLIISGGENIYPAEVERVLRSHRSIADAVVVGRPDARWGEVPIAVIVAADGRAPDPATIVEHCRAHLAAYKVPVAIQVAAELPRAEDGKMRRRAIRDRFVPTR